MRRGWEREGRKPNIVATIEARMGSSRLPGKVLMDLHGKPSLTRLLERLRHCQTVDQIVLATSTSPGDDQLVKWAVAEGVEYFRGSEDDVLQRVVDAQRAYDSDIVVEITGDCPLLDPGLVDMGVETFMINDLDCVTNCFKESFPLGADLMVMDFDSLQSCTSMPEPDYHEHVSLGIIRNPEQFKIVHLTAHPRWQGHEYRFMLDYPEDLLFIQKVYEHLYPVYGSRFGIEEMMELMRREPKLADINRNCGKSA